MTKQEIIQDETLFQRACGLWVERNIGQCVSSLMYNVGQNLEECARIFDFDYDEALDWFQCKDYESVVDNFIDDADLEDLETIADMVGDWEGVVYSVLGMSPEEYADEVTSEEDQAEDLKALRSKVKALITNGAEYTEIGQHFNLDPDYNEIYEHWTIPEGWTARELKDEGQVVFDFGGMTIWGRMTTGQCISLDGVVRRIVSNLDENHWIWANVKWGSILNRGAKS